MQLRRRLRHEIGVLRGLAPVIADRRRQSGQLCRREKGDRAAHAVPDDPDLAGALHRVDRGLGVAQHGAPVDARNEFARFLDFRRRVARFEIALVAVEHRGREGDIAVLGEAVAHAADVVVDAEYLLEHDEPALRPLVRIGPVSAEHEPV